MKKSLRIVGISLAALLLLAAALVTWALYTESGARSVLAVARGWFPPGLTVGETGGTIGGTLHVRNFRLHDPRVGMDLKIDRAEIEFSAFGLLARRLHVKRAQVDGILLDLFPGIPAAIPAGPARDPWVAPLDMFIDELQLTRGELRRVDAAPLQLQRVHLVGRWIGAHIEAEQLDIAGPDGDAALAVRIVERAPRLELLRGKFRWRIGEHRWAGTLDASGGAAELQLKANLESPVTVDLAGTLGVTRQDDAISAWRAHLAVARFDPHPVLDTGAFKTAALELDASGDRAGVTLKGVLSLDEQRIVVERLAATIRDPMVEVTELSLRLNSQPARLTGSGAFALDGSRPASAQLAWDEFHLPDAWMGKDFRCSGKLALTAAERRFAANGTARLARGARQSTLALRLDGSPDALHIQEFELTQTRGALSVAGNVELAQPARWQLDATAREFDPSLFLDGWPGALSFGLHTTGEWPESGPRARFQLTQLAGRLRNRAISGSGDVSIGPDRTPSGNLQLQSGGATLTAVASAGAQPRLDATLKVAALGEWRKQLGGSIEAQATAIGRWPDIELDARVTANQFRSGATRFTSAHAHLKGRHVHSPRGTLELDASGLELSGLRFETLEAKADGDAARHRLDLDARGEKLSLATRITGAYQRDTWSGLVEQLKVDAAQVPPLALAEPVRLVVARKDFELGRACLAGGDISLCADVRRDAGELAANYSIRALPLELLATLAAPKAELSVEGLIEGSGQLRRAANGQYSGRATLASASGAFAQGKDKEKETLRLEYRDFGIDIDLTPTAANAQLRGVLPKQGDLTGSMSVAVGENDPTLAGTATVKLQDLAPLGWWMPQLANLKGSGEVAAEVSGTVGTPRVAFTVRASGLDAEVPVLGVHLREGHVNASLQPGGAFTAQGAISSGEGNVQLSGGRNAQQALELKIAGDNFLAANVPGARVVIAPELSLAGKLGDLALTGTVKIDDADVNLEKLSISRSYRASSDVVVVDRDFEVKDRSPGLSTDVRVLLGDRVKISGFGLESTVSGELHVVEARDQPSRATGEIRLAGTYEAFGRKLNIERGKLVYAGTALEDPQLDILAVRKLQDVTAKLSITGTAQNPKLDVFTDPASSQTDAMSYLLTGKPASDIHGEDGQVVQSASQNAGILLGNRLAKKLGGKVGLVDQVGVEQNADLGGSAFTVGKYLSPKLFVSYGVGLFEPGSAMTVRYEFSERWSLEANDTPEDQHAGIRYRIEK